MQLIEKDGRLEKCTVRSVMKTRIVLERDKVWSIHEAKRERKRKRDRSRKMGLS